jgi:hypothetical protein
MYGNQGANMFLQQFYRNLITNPLTKEELFILELRIKDIMELNQQDLADDVADVLSRELDEIVQILQTNYNGMRKNKAGLKVVS